MHSLKFHMIHLKTGLFLQWKLEMYLSKSIPKNIPRLAYLRPRQTAKWKGIQEFLHELLVLGLGYVPGICWKTLRIQPSIFSMQTVRENSQRADTECMLDLSISLDFPAATG